FVAWDYDRVIGYNNFFPREFAQTTRFYGWGKKDDKMPETLIHHCISLVRHPKYHRKGIGTSLIKHSLDWCRENGWQQFEVH
ncbi:MAG: GNAT family N-acetyltransferase, partial [Phycisphaerae bacterium]|nr:GNAT family N-acetyltransferase [candidate division KSB1 bacterium]NIV01324.1 GNAT family N-acetyltransferase [Phycisphaerae bacterium]NIV69853.1 GNAT family N-acetyltransferase [Phycisphaerae bacterium]